ncbi:MAG: NIPSNAP family containing protein, partial [Oxalobacteraceae bacterium]
MTNRFFRLAAGLLALVSTLQAVASAPKREFYQLKIYHVRDANQKNRLETYLQKAYLPALHRAGIKQVGVFEPTTGADSLVY